MKIPIDNKSVFSIFLKDKNATVLSKPFFGKDNEIKGKKFDWKALNRKIIL